MYSLLIAMYLIFSIRENATGLLKVGSFAAFDDWNWIIFVITVLEVPLCIAMLVVGFREMREARLTKKQEEAEAVEQAKQAAIEKYCSDGEQETEPAEQPQAEDFNIFDH